MITLPGESEPTQGYGEPWSVDAAELVMLDAGGHPVAEGLFSAGEVAALRGPLDRMRRAALCVNFCAGRSDETLRELIAQRDEYKHAPAFGEIEGIVERVLERHGLIAAPETAEPGEPEPLRHIHTLSCYDSGGVLLCAEGADGFTDRRDEDEADQAYCDRAAGRGGAQ